MLYPESPAALNTLKSELGLAKVVMVEFPAAYGSALAYSRMSHPLSGLVAVKMDGPETPPASMLTTSLTSSAQRCCVANAAAPCKPVSSESVNSKMTVLRRGGPAPRARAVSSIMATPLPSSVAPGENGVESRCATSRMASWVSEPSILATMFSTLEKRL